MSNARARVIISGMVQGVFFRSCTRDEARGLCLTGWVKNRWDGNVEAVFEGERKDIDKMVLWCYKGPPSARVDNVETIWEEHIGEFDDFNVSY